MFRNNKKEIFIWKIYTREIDKEKSQNMPPVKRCRQQVLPRQQMPKATFSQPYITIYVYEKDQWIPKLCMTRTINLSNTQFRYQLVFFVHIYDYIWLAEGCLWHLLPRQNLWWHLLPRQNLLSEFFA